MSRPDFPDTRAELAAVNERLAALRAAPDRDKAGLVALELRARELRLRLQRELDAGLGPLREDGYYGSGY